MRFCHLSTETPINKATQFFQKVNKIFRKNPARSGLQTDCQSVKERTWVKWGWRLKNRLKVYRNYANKVCETRKLVKKLVKLSYLVIWIFKIWATMDAVHQRLRRVRIVRETETTTIQVQRLHKVIQSYPKRFTLNLPHSVIQFTTEVGFLKNCYWMIIFPDYLYFIQISNRSKVWTVEIKKDKFLT